MVADAFRIAFEQQLKKRSEHLLLLAEANILKSNHEKAEGKSAHGMLRHHLVNQSTTLYLHSTFHTHEE